MSQVIGVFGAGAVRLEKEIKLPSGRTVTVLETTGKQEALFNDLSPSELPSVINRYLAEVTTNLDGVSGHPDVLAFDKMLLGDRTAILLSCRILTHGNILEYTLDCSQCGKKSDHEIDIQKIVDDIKPYPENDQREFSVDLDGGTLYFELPTGLTEKKLLKTGKPDVNKKLKVMRVWEKTEKGTFPVDVDSLKSRHLAALRKAVKDKECEIDATAILVCPDCGKHHTTGVVDNVNFMFPHLI